MFEVSIMVEDKKLHHVLWQLDGLIVGQPTLRPVRDAAVKTSTRKGVKVKDVVAKANDRLRAVAEAIVTAFGGDIVSAKALHPVLAAHGIRDKTYAKVAVLQKLQKANVLTPRVGTKGPGRRYLVAKTMPAPTKEPA